MPTQGPTSFTTHPSVEESAGIIYERELEASMRVRGRWMGALMCAIWLYALLLVDAKLYGARDARFALRLTQLSVAVAYVLFLGRTRRLWQTELLVTSGACIVSALGTTSLLKLPESTFGFGVAFRFFAPMVVGYFLQLRWRSVLALHAVTWFSVTVAGYLRDPDQLGHQLLLLGMVIGVPYLLLVLEAWRREQRSRQEIQLREELRAANERLRSEEEARTRLFVNLNHDFRTPLALIRAEAELLRRAPGGVTDREALERIEANSQYLADLSEQLLELARLETGQTPCQPEPIRVDLIAREVAAQLQTPNGSPAIVVEASPTVADADPIHVRRILFNLVENGRRQQGVRELRVSITRESELVIVDVSDDGGGIPPARRDRIFERFATFDPDGRAHSGIGLPLSRELAQLNRGSLTLLEAPRTTFRLTLRSSSESPSVAEPAPTNTQPANTARAPASGAPVLLVEDNQEMRDVFQRSLGDTFEVRAVATLAGARKALEEFSPKAVVSDLMLPDGRGSELIAEVRSHRKHEGVPVLLVSALASTEHRIAGLRAGADDYLAKPFSPAELIARIHAAIERSEARRSALHKQRDDFVMELHDGVSGSLARAAILIDAGRPETALAAIREGLGEARSLMNLLESAPTSFDSVVAELRRELSEGCAQAGLSLDFTHGASESVVLSPAERHTVQRIAREALTNIVKHAGARTVRCLVSFETGSIRLRIEDDGKGLGAGTGGRGISILKRRAAQLGGTVTLGNGSPSGTRVEATIPLANAPLSQPLEAPRGTTAAVS